MTKYNVSGMSCAACSARVEKAVRGVEGVSECSVSLLTNSMTVEGTASPARIIAAVEAAGYGAERQNAKRSDADPAETAKKDLAALKRRLFWSLFFLAGLMYVSMGRMIGLPLPAFYAGNPVAAGLTQLLTAGIVMVINQRFFISGFRALTHRAPNMDTLVALGASAAFGYSVWALFAMSGAQANGEAAADYLSEFYFESAAMILTLITVGKLLEARAKGKTTDALSALLRLTPKTATVLRDGEEKTVPVEEIRVGDTFLVRPGEHIPADGTVTEGQSAVNEAALTGESLPSEKQIGSPVSAGTLNTSGFLRCTAARVGQDTTLAQIIRTVGDAAASKAPIAKIADRVSGVFVPTVIGIALITTVIWTVISRDFGYALARGISVLVISCPCALGLATPVAITVGSGVGAKHGILFKTAASLEQAGKTNVVVLDKTGTVTQGEPRVTDLLPAAGISEDKLLSVACALEHKSEHPLARAVTEEAKRRGISPADVSDFTVLPGKGLQGMRNGELLRGGNVAWIEPDAETQARAQELAAQGKTPLFFVRGKTPIGCIAVADVIKADSPQAIRQLRDLGLRVVLLTGDNSVTANAVGKQAGIDEIIAGVLPDEKEAVVRRLQSEGSVMMVGDGINDAPALTRADVGVAIGAGTDVAVDAADTVLMKSRLSDVPAAIRLSRAVRRNIRQNLFWAFFYNVVGIPLAAGAFVAAGLTLNPMFGAAAMSLSSVCVVTNALRLNLCDPYDPRHDKKKIKIKENQTMTQTLTVKGMMCAHCEARVKKALEAVPGVTLATPDHNTATVLVQTDAAVSANALKKAILDAGYEYEG